VGDQQKDTVVNAMEGSAEITRGYKRSSQTGGGGGVLATALRRSGKVLIRLVVHGAQHEARLGTYMHFLA